MKYASWITTTTCIWICGLAYAGPQVSGPEALNLLKQGNETSVQDPTSRAPAVPHTIVISCSDFNLMPETLFGQKSGDILTFRTPGETLDRKTVTAVENAITRFGTKLVLVLGHESCEAVKTALHPPAHPSGEASRVIASIQPGIQRFKNDDGKEGSLRAPVKANVFAAAKSLVQRSKVIRDAIQAQNLVVAQGIYSPATGKVEFSEDMGKVLVRLLKVEGDTGRKPASVEQKPAAKPKHVKVDPWKAKSSY